MNHALFTLVTDVPPRAHLGGVDGLIPVIQFGTPHGSAFEVQLPSAMTAAQRSAWCRRLRDEAGALAILIDRANAAIA